MSQDGAIARYYYVYGKRNLHSVVYVGYLYTILMAVLLLCIAWIMNSLIIFVVILASASQSILAVQLSLRQCQKQAWGYMALQIGTSLGSSVLTLLLLEFTDGMMIEKRFLAIFLGSIVVSIIAMCWFICNRPNVRLLWRRMRLSAVYILGFGLPLLLHHISLFLKGQLDRVILFSFYSAEQVGIYSAGLQVATIFSILLLAMNKALTPYYYQEIKNGKLDAAKVRYFSLYGLLVAIIPAASTFLLPEKLFLWFLGQQYIGVKNFIVLFLIGFGLTIPYFILINYLFYFGRNNRISTVSMISASTYVVVLLVVAPLGVIWTPLAMIISNVIILPLLFYQVRS